MKMWSKQVIRPPKWFLDWAAKEYNPIFNRAKHPKPKGLGHTHVWQLLDDLLECKGAWFVSMHDVSNWDYYQLHRPLGSHHSMNAGILCKSWRFGALSISWYPCSLIADKNMWVMAQESAKEKKRAWYEYY